jgi:pSer/pThr/pTyr-binding forkhead associated (FHA) protein
MLDNRVTLTVMATPAFAIKAVPVVGLQQLPDGPRYPFDDFCAEDQPKRTLLVGAHPNCDILVQDNGASARHCLLERHPRSVSVHDCGSKNKTYVDGVPCGTTSLRAGALLTVGTTTLLAFGPGEAAPQALIAASSLHSFYMRATDVYGSQRRAADAIGVPYSTLQGWIATNKYRKLGGRP